MNSAVDRTHFVNLRVMGSSNAEAQATCNNNDKAIEEGRRACHDKTRASWLSSSIITATTGLLTFSATGWSSNLIVYLIQEFNFKSIDAAQVFNIVQGSVTLLPILAAVIADSFFGCFSLIAVSIPLGFLGTILLSLTATLNSLRPHPCETGLSCQSPSRIQYTVLCAGIALGVIGGGGTRFTLSTLGANQFDTPESQGVFFDWFFIAQYVGYVLSAIGIVYMEDAVSWGLGFWISSAVSLASLAVFLLGARFYVLDRPRGSPFTCLARVVVAALRKRKVELPPEWVNDVGEGGYYYGQEEKGPPTPTLRFFNRAARKCEGDTEPDGTIARPWRLCTVQQVETLKSVIAILPLWSSSILLSTPIAVESSMTTIQALTLDRRLGPGFKVPAGSLLVLIMFSASVAIAFIDRLLTPFCRKLAGPRSLTLLQRIGIGHVINVVAIGLSALVESKRLGVYHSQLHRDRGNDNNSAVVQMSVLWLFPQLILVGVGEAFHFPGQVALYYRDFPETLRNSSTAMISLIISVAFYTSTALIDFFRRRTGWLPQDLNQGRLDLLYWTLAAIGSLNFGYYLLCAKFYKKK